MANEEQAARKRLREISETISTNREIMERKREENANLKKERDALRASIGMEALSGNDDK